MKSLWGVKAAAWNALAHSFIILQFLILILCIAEPNLWFRCDKRGVCTWGGDQFEVLKCGGLPLVITEVVTVGGDEDKKVYYFHKIDLGDSLELHRFWSLGAIFFQGWVRVCVGGMPPDPPRFPVNYHACSKNKRCWYRILVMCTGSLCDTMCP